MLMFKELDKRHSGYGTFAYRVQVTGTKSNRMVEFDRVRQWCWETFGPSCERDSYKTVNPSAPWAWHIETDHYMPYIYIANTDAESLFKLKWM